ncbi:MAG TPA: glycoside hydrolase family 16 protein [Polyangiaceae bacterium]|nr:glycoside hydrolase family 16 protein [Polyangiaceae bacterium]
MLSLAAPAGAVTLAWKGLTWQVTSGAMAGVCAGDPANVSVDASGYLHLRISKNGSTWSAAELFTTEELGFGTFQWQIDGPIDVLDQNVVVGLFPYGPQAGIGADGTNEIDIEYARWGEPDGPNGDFTDYPASGKTVGESSYTFSLAGSTLSTSRFVWSSTAITDFLFAGLVDVARASGSLQSFTYMPSNPATNIPQQALPLGMNLWCFDAPPSDGNPVEIVIRDFVFVAEGTETGGGGAGGDGTLPGAGGSSAGSTSHGGTGALAGSSGRGDGASGRTGGGGRAGGGAPQTSGGASESGGAPSPGAGGSGTAHGGAAGTSQGLAAAGGAPTSGTTNGGTTNGGAAVGISGAASSDAAPRSSSNCGCRVGGSEHPSQGAGVFGALLAWTLSRRRRRATRSPM